MQLVNIILIMLPVRKKWYLHLLKMCESCNSYTELCNALRWYFKYFYLINWTVITSFKIKLQVMKNLLYLIAGLLIAIWAVFFLGFNSSGIVHMLLVLAGFILLVRLYFGKQLSHN